MIGAVVRDGDVITPRGDDAVVPGDRVIVFALPETVATVEKFLA